MRCDVFASNTVALFGLGASGEATALALQAGGATVWAWDDAEESRNKAAQKGVNIQNLSTADWGQITALILAPGVPLTHPQPHWVVEKAHAAKVQIIGDVELFFRQRAAVAPHSKCVCITGTNGKSTTTALVAHLLQGFGQNVQMGGNIGVPVLQLETPTAETIHVLEISTFQSDLASSIAPTVGVLLNLAEDHLDRHGTMAHYAALKQHVVAQADVAIMGQDDEDTRTIHQNLKMQARHIIPISAARALQNGFSAEGQSIVYCEDRVVKARFHLQGIRSLRGQHNAQNAAAALAVLYQLGFADPMKLQAGLNSFSGLPHRMEEVARKGNVLFINDSKATNADATQRALSSFNPIYWIVGGKDKSDGIAPLEHFFPRVRKAYLIGYAAKRFASTLEGKVPYVIAETMEIAVKLAAQDAAQDLHDEPAVLLSPACASYDQFKNFEHRGEVFRMAVHAVLQEAAA